MSIHHGDSTTISQAAYDAFLATDPITTNAEGAPLYTLDQYEAAVQLVSTPVADESGIRIV